MICTLLVSSCFYLRMYHFNDDDRVWLSPYEQGDTILFKSAEGIDTSIVKETHLQDSYWPFMKNEANCIMEAYGYVDIDLIHQGKSLHGGMVSITKKSGRRLEVFLAFAHRVVESEQSELVLKRMNINHVFYPDACVCIGKDYSYPDDIKCEYFIWSKSKGLIQYKYLNGETYTFYKKLPYKVTHAVLIIGYDRNKQSEYRCMDPWNDSSQNGRYIYYNASRFRDVYRFK